MIRAAMTWLFQLTSWRVFRPKRAPWGESTSLWTDGDWRWFRTYEPDIPETIVWLGTGYSDAQEPIIFRGLVGGKGWFQPFSTVVLPHPPKIEELYRAQAQLRL